MKSKDKPCRLGRRPVTQGPRPLLGNQDRVGKSATGSSGINIKSWTGLEMREMLRLTEDRKRWRNIVHDAAEPRNEDGQEQEQEQHS